MSAIRSKENRTESEVRRKLHKAGFRYRKYPGLAGRPDFAFMKERVAVFIDGDYWHARMIRERGVAAAEAYFTEKQRTYWLPKLLRTIERDDENSAALAADGWVVLRFWESVTQSDMDGIVKIISDAVISRRGLRQ